MVILRGTLILYEAWFRVAQYLFSEILYNINWKNLDNDMKSKICH